MFGQQSMMSMVNAFVLLAAIIQVVTSGRVRGIQEKERSQGKETQPEVSKDEIKKEACVDLTGKWTCKNLVTGITWEDNVSQEQCNGSMTEIKETFAISGDKTVGTSGDFFGMPATVSPSGTKLESVLFLCTRVSE